MAQHPYIVLGGFIAVSFLPAISGAVFRADSWYDQLAKPSWRPPRWLFAPAWTLLFITIAIAGWLVWRTEGFAEATFPLTVWGISLAINATWSSIFFGIRRLDLAFVDIVLLWLSIIATIVVFYPVNMVAAWVLVPYLCWVTFAATLNFTVWRMNSGVTV